MKSISSVRDFITNALALLLENPDFAVSDINAEILDDFLHNPQTLLLQVSVNHGNLKFQVYLQCDLNKSIIFYKTLPCTLIENNSLNNVNMLTLSTNAALSLYQTLKQIYSPLLANGDDLYSNKIHKNLSDLESNLRVIAHGKEDVHNSFVLSIEDEANYWKSVAERKDTSKADRDAALSFSVMFDDIAEEIKLMRSCMLEEVKDSVENVAGILDDVWRYVGTTYSQDRMMHVFDIFGHVTSSIIQKFVSDLNIWVVHHNAEDDKILAELSHGLKAIQTLISACKSLTETYWPNYALHPWKGKSFVPLFCVNFEGRLKQIYDIRSTFNQLNKLMTNTENMEFGIDDILSTFQNINMWIINGPNHQWESAVSKLSANIRQAEMNVAEKLKPRFQNTSVDQVLYEFQRYKTLMCRAAIKSALSTELERLVAGFAARLAGVHQELDAGERSCPPDLSPTVRRVQWAKRAEAKVNEIKTCTEMYLSDFDKSSEVISQSTTLLKDLKSTYTQCLEDWSRELQVQVRSGSLSLSLERPVLEFRNGLLTVTLNARALTWVTEARALVTYAPLPPAAARALSALSDALPHARALDQIASFHNTIGERMIPSTRPIMLQAALDLSALVQDQKPVYWNDEQQLTEYIDRLKTAVMKLETENTYLTGQHIAIRNLVEQLMDTELLAQQSQWKKHIKDIRDIIEKVESSGYKNTEMWRSHWDMQLYKAIECQYIKAMLSLETHFPSVKVDLVLRGSTVCLQPRAEELRATLYAQLRRLVALPSHIPPLAAANDALFASIVQKHSWIGNKAVCALEAALAATERVRVRWARRSAACGVDLNALCAEHLTTHQHFEHNFKACKAFGQAVAKMTFEDEKVYWITISPWALRRELEGAAHRLWGSLVSALRANCRTHADSLAAFVAAAAALAARAPATPRDLADLSAERHAVRSKIPEMEELVEDLKNKGHMLRTWGGDSTVDDAIKEWQRVRGQFDSQQELFEHQAETVKAGLLSEWDSVQARVEAWVGRWGVRVSDVRADTLAELSARAADLNAATQLLDELRAEGDQLMMECKKFNIDLDITSTWNDAEELVKDFNKEWSVLLDYNQELETLGGTEWVVFQRKLHALDEFAASWAARLEPYTPVTLLLKQDVDRYTDLTPALKYLRGTDFTERHWREIFNVLEMEPKNPDNLLLKDLLRIAPNIRKHMKDIQKISASASSEAAIRSTLNEIELWFAGARFTLTHYTDFAGRTVPIVKDYKDFITKVSELQWAGSAGGAAARAWLDRLHAAGTLARAAHHAQRRWLYLEPILATDDGELGVKFRKVDQAFKQVARIFEADPRLSVLMQSTRLQPMLDSISEQMNSCQSALNQYMDNKRTIFPRLYFLSDDDLLELLGQARAGAEGREAVMQTHLKKLFPGITGVKLGPGGLSITALCSHFGETLQLDQPVDIDCPVEVWLKNFEIEIRSSLKNLTMKCLKTNSLLEQDPFSLPTQIICLAQNIRFTRQVEKAINSKELHELKNNLEKESVYYAETEVEDESEKYKRQALILQCDFHILAVQSLIEGNVVATSDWLWQKQLRFYFQDNDVVAKMALASIPYSYEYLGVQTGQFVRTSETDECFLILTQSLHLGLVGNPFGPAGTGKTESVKALGALFGRLVLVFNCDEAMDSACVGRVLRGLALSGAWGCLDEFNRLSAAALATAAHQLAALVTDQRPLLDGKEVSVSPWCGVMVTMNPSGRGYGGRRALPSALSALLRPLALRSPDARELATRLLVARRVPAQDARVLAAALHDVFTFASSLLSGARHYDWGLRALKAAVGACGAALERRAGRVALATLRDVLRLTSSKLTAYDAQRFEKILSMVFAGVPEEEEMNNTLRSALESAMTQLNLIHNEFQIQKCKELHELMQQRIGVAIVGPPGSGKSTIRKILKTALSLLGHAVSERTVRPKAMSRAWLLGRADGDTRAWADGVVAALAHHAAALPIDVSGWMVFDGDVDPGWAEALNSLLDDNRLLALAGSRVQLPAHAHAIFETHQLDAASPATVSRLAIILLNEDNNCAPQVLESYMKTAEFDDELAKIALPQLQTAIMKCIQWFNSNRSDLNFKSDDISMVHQFIAQFEYLVQNTKSNNAYTSVEDIVYLSVERSVSGIVKDNALDKFYEHVVGGVRIHNLEEDKEESETGRVVWSLRLRRAAVALRALLRTTHNVLLIGPDASGKSVISSILHSLLLEQTLRDYQGAVVTIECTPLLEPEDILMELKRNNVLRSSEAGEVGAVAGDGDATILVRGLHRVHTDRWGSRPVHAFLLQLCAGGAWEVGGDGPQWLRARVRVLATARSPADISPRLRAAFALVILDETDEDELLELSKIRLRENVTKNLSDEEVLQLARSIVFLYKDVTETFISQPHYKWNTSHIETMCENIKWYSPASLQDVHMALNAEANMMFLERLVTDDEKQQYKLIAEKYLKCGSELYFMPRLRSDGVYLEAMDYDEWCRNAGKLINQCLTDNENVFGDSGAEVSTDLAALFPAIAAAMRGSVAVCVSAAGGGVSAAAQLVCAAIAATCHTPPIAPAPLAIRLANTFKTALTSASDGMRVCILLHAEGSQDVNDDDGDDDSAAACLAHVEALVRARTAHALPAALARAAPNATEVTLNDIKQNLGIVICIDKNEESLWQLFSRYPWLSRAPQWVGKWSDATLRRMPALIVQRLIKESGQEITRDDIDSIPVEGFVNIYRSLQSSSMQAPCRYVNLIRSYYHILTRKKEALVQRENVLSAGVEALKRARIEVATLQKEATTQEAALSEEQTKANAALEQISATVRANSDKKEEMNKLKKDIERENEQLQIRKKEIEEQLAAVEPVIAAARAAVGDIRQDALSEVRSLRAPPDAVRDVLEGVLRLMGIGDTSWHSMKNFLAKRGVKEDIRRLDASDISHEAVTAVSRLVERRTGSFEDATARRASAACAPLAAWVRAQLSHAAALRHVRPLREKQQELESAVRSAESQLAALVSGVASVEERVATLTRALGEHTRAAATLELRLADAAAALARATALLDHLAHEYDAWERQLEEITKELAELNSLSLLAAAYIVYLPELTEQQARDVIKSWAMLMGHEDLDFSPSNFLSSPDKQFKWIADGLPSDQTALKNAIVIDQYFGEVRCGFPPLIIDPDGEAEAWLRTTLHGAPVDFVPQHSDKLKTAVQYAIRHSRLLVITEVEGCGWWCGAARTLQLSREPRRTAPRPRCAARTTVVYFEPRLHALIDQLSHYTIQNQNPSMIERYKEVKLQKVALQKQQHELQENLLRELSQARDILHDEALSQTLQKTRATGEHIAAALAAADQIEAEVSRASAAHAPLAARAAALALATKRLQPRRPTLQLPFDCVQAQFLDTVQRYQDIENANVDEAVRYFMRTMFDRIQLSLHRKDRYVVLMHLLKQVYDDMMPDKLWKIFINHISIVEDTRVVDEIKRQHDWIGDEYLSKLVQIKMQDEDLYNRLSLDNAQLWSGYQTSGDETTIRRLDLNPFEHVLAVTALRPQSTYRAVVAFVDKVLGLSRGGSSVERAERYGTRARPVLLLGAHAALQLVAYAHAHAHTLNTVGIEEGISAWEAALRTCQKGTWLAIVVGASPFSRDLQAFVASLAQRSVEDLSEDFRLWIITEDREVPSMIASMCVNVVLEAPEGVKHNVCGTLRAWTGGVGSRAPPPVVRHLACLALFHAVLQERRAYIPQGWSKWYEWEWGEAVAARRVVLGAGATQAARELCGALYAARADAARDRRVLRALRRSLLDAAPHRQWAVPALFAPLPFAPDLTTYLEAFNTLPEADPPELLFLPANYRLAWEKNAADNMISGLREYDTTTNITKTETSTPINVILGLWKKYMSGSPLIKGDFDIEKACGGGWWRGVCAGEARDAQAAARALHRALSQLARAPQPTAIALHEVPDEWHLLWPGPESPEEYIKEFCFRARAAVERVRDCKRTEDIPKEVDVRTFLHPARILSALRASAAERTRRAPHLLALDVTWAPTSESTDGVLVVGLRLSGGEWAAGGIRPASAHAAPHAPAPPLLLRYAPTDDSLKDSTGFSVEVYSDESRRAALWRVRAPLGGLLAPDVAELHALALYVAPAHSK